MARPMPDAAPVTTAMWFSRRGMAFPFAFFDVHYKLIQNCACGNGELYLPVVFIPQVLRHG
jgi:hypothetical protein